MTLPSVGQIAIITSNDGGRTAEIVLTKPFSDRLLDVGVVIRANRPDGSPTPEAAIVTRLDPAAGVIGLRQGSGFPRFVASDWTSGTPMFVAGDWLSGAQLVRDIPRIQQLVRRARAVIRATVAAWRDP